MIVAPAPGHYQQLNISLALSTCYVKFIWLKTILVAVTFYSANIIPLAASKTHREIGGLMKIFEVY